MGFAIQKLFHTTHCVDDVPAADAWLQRVFGRTSRQAGYSPTAYRTAIFTTIGDVNFESISSQADKPSPILRFYERYGAHLHSIAWWVEGIRDLTVQLQNSGARLFGEGGIPVRDHPTDSGGMGDDFLAIFSHPRDTFGMLEFAEMSPAFAVIRAAREQEQGISRLVAGDGADPLGIELHRSHTVAVTDLAAARKFMVDVLQAVPFHEDENPLLQTRSLYLQVGTASTIELAQPLVQDSPAAKDVENCGDIFHALVFKVSDLPRAIAHLEANGVTFEARSDAMVVTNPATTLGARLGFASAYAPNDPTRGK